MNAVLLRHALPSDYPGMHRVRMAVRENALSSPGRITRSDYMDAIRGAGRSWVAELNGEIAGFASALSNGNLWALFVHPDHEGLGFGTALHDAAVDWLRSQQLPRVWLTTGPGTRAERYYARRGWRCCGPTATGEILFELDEPRGTSE